MRARAWVAAPDGHAQPLEQVEVQLPELGPTDVLVRHRAIGLNFMDIYYRRGTYPNPSGRLGAEAAGVVEQVGTAVTGLVAGDRVAYAGGPNGAYADRRVIDARYLVPLPPEVGFADAAAVLFKGMTAGMLLTRVTHVQQGDRVLVHAAAGGVGLFLGQWLRALGAEAIGVAGGPRKCEQAVQSGYTHAIDHQAGDVAERVQALTAGRGVGVVFDGVGQDTFEASLASLAPRGMLVSFGAASGAPPPVPIGRLAAKSLYLTRPSLTAYTATRDELAGLAADVLERLGSGVLRPTATRYPFEQLAQAHDDLEQRRTAGSVVVECGG